VREQDEHEEIAAAGHVAKRDEYDHDSSEVGSSTWRSLVLRQSKQLREELDAAERQLPQGDNALVAQTRLRIAQAERLARAPTKWGTLWATFRNWWTGNGVETAWNDLQRARETLMLIEPSDQVQAQIPALQRRIASASPDPAHDPHLAQLRDIAASTTDLTDDQRSQVAAAHEHVAAIQTDHSAARQFRNNLLLWTAGLAVGALALAGITSHGFRYVLVGALAGLLTTAVAWRSLTHLSGPYSVSTAQATLKVSAGASSALLGCFLCARELSVASRSVQRPRTGTRSFSGFLNRRSPKRSTEQRRSSEGRDGPTHASPSPKRARRTFSTASRIARRLE
jgi:hypothetical protein